MTTSISISNNIKMFVTKKGLGRQKTKKCRNSSGTAARSTWNNDIQSRFIHYNANESKISAGKLSDFVCGRSSSKLNFSSNKARNKLLPMFYMIMNIFGRVATNANSDISKYRTSILTTTLFIVMMFPIVPGCQTLPTAFAAGGSIMDPVSSPASSMNTYAALTEGDGIDATSILLQQGTVLLSCVGVGLYWWKSVVPSERRTLAKQKRTRGASLEKYLEELEKYDEYDKSSNIQIDGNSDKSAEQVDFKMRKTIALERWFYSDWLSQRRAVRVRKSNRSINNKGTETDIQPDMETGIDSSDRDGIKLRNVEERSPLDGIAEPCMKEIYIS